jgi:hypothetical protein
MKGQSDGSTPSAARRKRKASQSQFSIRSSHEIQSKFNFMSSVWSEGLCETIDEASEMRMPSEMENATWSGKLRTLQHDTFRNINFISLTAQWTDEKGSAKLDVSL